MRTLCSVGTRKERSRAREPLRTSVVALLHEFGLARRLSASHGDEPQVWRPRSLTTRRACASRPESSASPCGERSWTSGYSLPVCTSISESPSLTVQAMNRPSGENLPPATVPFPSLSAALSSRRRPPPASCRSCRRLSGLDEQLRAVGRPRDGLLVDLRLRGAQDARLRTVEPDDAQFNRTIPVVPTVSNVPAVGRGSRSTQLTPLEPVRLPLSVNRRSGRSPDRGWRDRPAWS